MNNGDLLKTCIKAREKLNKKYLESIRHIRPEEIDIDKYDGWIGCDEKGYYCYEGMGLYSAKSRVGKERYKFYINDSYEYMETKIIDVLDQLINILTGIEKKTAAEIITSSFELAALESIFITLMTIHNSDSWFRPLLSIREIDEQIKLSSSLTDYSCIVDTYYNNKSPLLIGSLLVKTFESTVNKFIGDETANNIMITSRPPLVSAGNIGLIN